MIKIQFFFCFCFGARLVYIFVLIKCTAQILGSSCGIFFVIWLPIYYLIHKRCCFCFFNLLIGSDRPMSFCTFLIVIDVVCTLRLALKNKVWFELKKCKLEIWFTTSISTIVCHFSCSQWKSRINDYENSIRLKFVLLDTKDSISSGLLIFMTSRMTLFVASAGKRFATRNRKARKKLINFLLQFSHTIAVLEILLTIKWHWIVFDR